MSHTRVAVVQVGPVPFDKPATIEKLRALVADAASQGAQLIVLPEAFVTAYPKGLDSASPLALRSPILSDTP